MFGSKTHKIRHAWRPLDPDDPFVEEFGEPGEMVWNGVSAIDWTKRLIPGTPREACESLLVLTNRRLLCMGQGAGGLEIVEVRHEDGRPATVRTVGAQGIVTVHARFRGQWQEREYSMPRAMAQVFTEEMNTYMPHLP